jgi:hypothetical protein
MSDAPGGPPREPVTVPGPNPDWLESQDWVTDTLAIIEERQFPQVDTLPGRIEANKVAIQRVLGWCIPASIVFAFLLFWAAVMVYVWHLLAPSPHWLTQDELEHLKSMLFSSAVGALVAEGSRRYLSHENAANSPSTGGSPGGRGRT